jgi:hypothetical protein
MRFTWFLARIIIGYLFCLHGLYAAGPPFHFFTNDGNTSVKFGFLAQPQFEALENADGVEIKNNLFFRRLRLMAGGKISSRLSYFLESDSPNLGKEGMDGKHTSDIFLQDAYVSYAFGQEFQLDGGMIIIPASHNSAQTASSLMTIDYGAYSCLASTPTRSKNGRDYGMQARGYIKKHLEYRMGIYRGNRNHEGDFPYRYTARVVYYPLEADTGFFYSGTSLGAKKIVAIGASFDRQGSYSSNAVDVYVDHPLPNGDAITAQANFIHYDGGRSFASLARQNTWLLEGAYYLKILRVGPFIQYSSRNFSSSNSPDDSKVQAGLSYWIQKNRVNLKAAYGKLLKDNSPDRSQFLVQAQFFYY